MKLMPLDNRVVLEPLDAQDKTTGGIYLPDTAKEKPQVGKVVAAGPGKLLDDGKRNSMSVKVGDQVIYGKYTGNDVEVEGKKLVILRESDLLGIVDR
jgi:chaperonin GroES